MNSFKKIKNFLREFLKFPNKNSILFIITFQSSIAFFLSAFEYPSKIDIFFNEIKFLSIYVGILTLIVPLLIYLAQIEDLIKKRILLYKANLFFLMTFATVGTMLFIFPISILGKIYLILIAGFLVLISYFNVIKIETSIISNKMAYIDYLNSLVINHKKKNIQKFEEGRYKYLENRLLTFKEYHDYSRVISSNEGKVTKIYFDKLEKLSKKHKEKIIIHNIDNKLVKIGTVIFSTKSKKIAEVIEKSLDNFIEFNQKFEIIEELELLKEKTIESIKEQKYVDFCFNLEIYFYFIIKKNYSFYNQKLFFDENILVKDIIFIFEKALENKEWRYITKTIGIINNFYIRSWENKNLPICIQLLDFLDKFYWGYKVNKNEERTKYAIKCRLLGSLKDVFKWSPLTRFKLITEDDEKFILNFSNEFYKKIFNLSIRAIEDDNLEICSQYLIEAPSILKKQEKNITKKEILEEIKIRKSYLFFGILFYIKGSNNDRAESILNIAENYLKIESTDFIELIPLIIDNDVSFYWHWERRRIEGGEKTENPKKILELYVDLLLKYQYIPTSDLLEDYRFKIDDILKIIETKENSDNLKIYFSSQKNKFEIKEIESLKKLTLDDDNLRKIEQKINDICFDKSYGIFKHIIKNKKLKIRNQKHKNISRFLTFDKNILNGDLEFLINNLIKVSLSAIDSEFNSNFTANYDINLENIEEFIKKDYDNFLVVINRRDIDLLEDKYMFDSVTDNFCLKSNRNIKVVFVNSLSVSIGVLDLSKLEISFYNKNNKVFKVHYEDIDDNLKGKITVSFDIDLKVAKEAFKTIQI